MEKNNKRAVVVQLMSTCVNKLYNNQKIVKLVLFSTAWFSFKGENPKTNWNMG